MKGKDISFSPLFSNVQVDCEKVSLFVRQSVLKCWELYGDGDGDGSLISSDRKYHQLKPLDYNI